MTKKTGDPRTKKEIGVFGRIYGQAFGSLKLQDLTAELLLKWIDGYETQLSKLQHSPSDPRKPKNQAFAISEFFKA